MKEGLGGLPDGWTEHVDKKTGQTFFRYMLRPESDQWEHPQENPMIAGKELMTDYFLGNPKFDEGWKRMVNQTKDKDLGVLEEYIRSKN